MNGIEMVIIKYSLGAAFAVLIISFGVKIIMLLSLVAKAKTLAALEGLRHIPYAYDIAKFLIGGK